MIEFVKISTKVLSRLSAMDYELVCDNSSEQLIFPNKIQAKGNVKRISEQELRFLFVEEFKKAYPKMFYSIETPTKEKYKFGKSYNDIKVDENGQSASLDMCVFEKNKNYYQRILNIEFKHKNASINKIGKDILKLMHEKQNGAFIHLLNNTDSGTLCNKREKGVFNKLYKSFADFKTNWSNDNKYIQIVIFSLKQQILIHRKIIKTDLKNINDIFFVDSGCGNIKEIKENGWSIEIVN